MNSILKSQREIYEIRLQLKRISESSIANNIDTRLLERRLAKLEQEVDQHIEDLKDLAISESHS